MGCAKDGVEGPRGPQGNANVHSQIITVNPSDWTNSFGYHIVGLQVASITSDIVATGAVMVYSSYEGTSWVALPYTLSAVDHSYEYDAGAVQVRYEGGEAIAIPTTFKVITLSSSGMIPSDLDLTDYDAVKDYFKLEEK